MIRADEGLAEARDVDRQEMVPSEPFTTEDQALLYSLDADIEDAASTRQLGEMLEVNIARDVPTPVMVALKQMWQSGGWLVGVFQSPADSEHAYRMVFARPHMSSCASQAMELPEEEAPRIVLSDRPRLLVRMPTRARPHAIDVLAQYRSMAADPKLPIEVILDEDDAVMNSAAVLQRLSELGCTITIGRHSSKVEACNSGQVRDWDILLLASDDMVPVHRGYDARIVELMESHFPLFDGALCLDDGHNRQSKLPGHPILCTLPILGRHLYDQFGYVYQPEYQSLFCDNEQTAVLASMGRMAFVDELLIEHRHPAIGKGSSDELYRRNDSSADEDIRTFQHRRVSVVPHSQFGFAQPPLWLSILICSTSVRAEMRSRLVEHIRRQAAKLPGSVEILVDADDRKTVGHKRNDLMRRAIGHMVAFVDDDDWVAHNYCLRIVDAVKSYTNSLGSIPDCCSLVGEMTTDGKAPRRFEHMLGLEWSDDGDIFKRPPNHLNAIKRTTALQVGFQNSSYGEDRDFSIRLAEHLKMMVRTGDKPLYYYRYRTKGAMGQ